MDINRADGSVRIIKGYKKKAPGADAKKYSAKLSADRLPARVDLRPYLTQVEDQGGTNSCVANAVAGAFEYLVKRQEAENAYDVSRLFIYYNARAQESDEVDDEGTSIDAAINGVNGNGACSEESWPFDEERVNEEPSEEAFEEAEGVEISGSELVPTILEEWKKCLAEGNPIVFGLSLFESFDRHRRKGYVPKPSNKEVSRADHSGHAMLCVGYSDPDNMFIVRNSWGESWGDAGYCYIPYDYLMNAKFNDGDSWIIRQVEDLEIDEELWGDGTPLFEEVTSDLEEMTEEEYEDFLNELGDFALEYRLTQLFLYGASYDDDLSDEELSAAANILQGIFDRMDSTYSVNKVLRYALKDSDNEELAVETAEIFGEYLLPTTLASIVDNLEEISEADGDLSADEEDFVSYLIEEWELDEDEPQE